MAGGAAGAAPMEMKSDAKPVSGRVLAGMTILSFVIFGLGLVVSVAFGGL
jgi:hypothetical protein